MFLFVPAGNEDIVKIDEDAFYPPGDGVHHALEGLGQRAFSQRPKGILWNSNRLKGVVMALFGMSPGATGIL